MIVLWLCAVLTIIEKNGWKFRRKIIHLYPLWYFLLIMGSRKGNILRSIPWSYARIWAAALQTYDIECNTHNYFSATHTDESDRNRDHPSPHDDNTTLQLNYKPSTPWTRQRWNFYFLMKPFDAIAALEGQRQTRPLGVWTLSLRERSRELCSALLSLHCSVSSRTPTRRCRRAPGAGHCLCVPSLRREAVDRKLAVRSRVYSGREFDRDGRNRFPSDFLRRQLSYVLHHRTLLEKVVRKRNFVL